MARPAQLEPSARKAPLPMVIPNAGAVRASANSRKAVWTEPSARATEFAHDCESAEPEKNESAWLGSGGGAAGGEGGAFNVTVRSKASEWAGSSIYKRNASRRKIY